MKYFNKLSASVSVLSAIAIVGIASFVGISHAEAAIAITPTVPTTVTSNEWIGLRADYTPNQSYSKVKIIIEVWKPGNCTATADERLLSMPGQNLTSGTTYRFSASYYPTVMTTTTAKYRFGFGVLSSTGTSIAYSIPACGNGMGVTAMRKQNSNWPLSGLYTSTDTNTNFALARFNLAMTENDPNLDIYKRYSQIPFALWLTTDMTSYNTTRLLAHIAGAATTNKMPVVVLYNIPDRDCAGNGAGSGGYNTQSYSSWISSIVSTVNGGKVVYILEPDALTMYNSVKSTQACYHAAGSTWLNNRKALLSNAVTSLKANPNAHVYIDSGHSGWQTAAEMATRLNSVNINKADGFSLNVAARNSDGTEVTYGNEIRSQAGSVAGKHYVIDRSRNGNPAARQWCDDPATALGALPTGRVGSSFPNVDAFLWVKTAYTADGCPGGYTAGQAIWPANTAASTPSLALDFAKAAPSNW